MLSTAEPETTSWPLLPAAAAWLEGEPPADTERANNYYRARYYDPKNGRFVGEDPAGFNGDVNLFAYVTNNPVNWVDPSGLVKNPYTTFHNNMDKSSRHVPLDGIHNGPLDAYRHCVTSCEIARTNGEKVAQFLGWVNEKMGDYTHGQETGERAMDDFNNAYGRSCAKKAAGTRDCELQCYDGVIHGKTKTYTPGTTPSY
jgi:RHS repeat-associated protein